MVRIPLLYAPLRQTGEMTVKAEVRLMVRTVSGRFEPLDFLVDPGANLTAISVARARRRDLAIPARTVALSVNTAVGTVIQHVHPGRITVQIPGIDGTFSWPCHFVEHGPGIDPMPQLGLSGVLNDLRLTFDGTYALDARYGVFHLERYAVDAPA